MSGALGLELRDVSKSFGNLQAVDGVSLRMQAAGTYGLIGPNGAGKTTLFNLISGAHRPSSGAVLLDDEEVTGTPPEGLARRGVLRTFQNTSVFDSLSVLDNLLVGAYLVDRRTAVSAFLRPFRHHRADVALRERAEDVLDLVGMTSRRGVVAKSLAYGELRYLEIAVALMSRPRLLLLDEPGAGLNEAEVTRLEAILGAITTGRETTVVLVEHNVGLVSRACERIWVLDRGRLVVDGTPDVVLSDQRVREVYLGA
ncbi:ABC transporter ATP-binding protein [Pseudonocardia ailaonensis]|uniref:ABC transporter ATP-binding protein n=1 Tax=Pseudonocardia ailaonensis TaxID=367279 RepID=A0ABN2N177_9PSEU